MDPRLLSELEGLKPNEPVLPLLVLDPVSNAVQQAHVEGLLHEGEDLVGFLLDHGHCLGGVGVHVEGAHFKWAYQVPVLKASAQLRLLLLASFTGWFFSLFFYFIIGVLLIFFEFIHHALGFI